MDIIKWRSSYETGISSMDEQHKQLIALINTMYRILWKGEDTASIDHVLKEMVDYADKHLQEEESLLQVNEFPDYEEHILLHKTYQEKLTALTQDWNQEDSSTAKNIYAFLRQWWLEHIVESDKKYGPFLQEKGVK